MAQEVYTLKQLAAAARTAPRTIRFYIARDLMPGPVQAGRNAHYDRSHLRRLRRIGELKQKGLTLAEIAVKLDAGGQPRELPAPTPLAGMVLSEDVQVLIRTDVPPWRLRQVRKILSETARQLNANQEQERE
jgi:DNA-binding transcriptional MerR regulator